MTSKEAIHDIVYADSYPFVTRNGSPTSSSSSSAAASAGQKRPKEQVPKMPDHLHQSLDHGIGKFFKCPFCSFEIYSKQNLVNHIYDYHKDSTKITSWYAAHNFVYANSFPFVMRNGGSGVSEGLKISDAFKSLQTPDGQAKRVKDSNEKEDKALSLPSFSFPPSPSPFDLTSPKIDGALRNVSKLVLRIKNPLLAVKSSSEEEKKNDIVDGSTFSSTSSSSPAAMVAAGASGVTRSSINILPPPPPPPPRAEKALPFSCQVPDCDQVGVFFPGVTEADRRAAGEEHLKSKHKQFIDKINNKHMPVCITCGFWCDSQDHLSIHKRLHDSLDWKVCDFCPYSAATTDDVTKHILSCVKNPSRAPSTLTCCDLCDELVSQYSDHLAARHGIGKFYKCLFCEHETYIKNNLVAHIYNNHKDKPSISSWEAAHDIVFADFYPIVRRGNQAQ